MARGISVRFGLWTLRKLYKKQKNFDLVALVITKHPLPLCSKYVRLGWGIWRWLGTGKKV